MLEEEVSLMEEVKTVTLERLFAEHHSTGENVEVFRLKDMNKFLCPDCNILMNRVLPSVHYCGFCGNLLCEEAGNEKLNFPDTYHLTNIREGLYTVRVAPIETKQSIDLHHNVHHEVKLKPTRTRKKTWLTKEKGKTVQIEEEEAIE